MLLRKMSILVCVVLVLGLTGSVCGGIARIGMGLVEPPEIEGIDWGNVVGDFNVWSESDVHIYESGLSCGEQWDSEWKASTEAEESLPWGLYAHALTSKPYPYSYPLAGDPNSLAQAYAQPSFVPPLGTSAEGTAAQAWAFQVQQDGLVEVTLDYEILVSGSAVIAFANYIGDFNDPYSDYDMYLDGDWNNMLAKDEEIVIDESKSGSLTISHEFNAGDTAWLGLMVHSHDSYIPEPPIPEPATVAILGLGSLMLFRRRRRRTD